MATREVTVNDVLDEHEVWIWTGTRSGSGVLRPHLPQRLRAESAGAGSGGQLLHGRSRDDREGVADAPRRAVRRRGI